MKLGEELYNKVFEYPMLPRKAVLKPNLHHGRQDLLNLEARTSVDHQSKQSVQYRETRGEEFGEYQVYHTQTFHRRMMLAERHSRKLVHQFETHPKHESLMADLDKNQKFNLFCEKSKELIRSMGNTERCARSLPKNNAKTAYYFGKGALYIVFGANACNFRKKSTTEERSI